jgi:micrococcal nuclease
MENENYLYHYKAKVLEIYDADTIRVEINLGFGFTWRGSDNRGVEIRLYGLNAPEMRGNEKESGTISRDKLKEQILGKEITLKTIKDKSEKYGRYLGIIIKEDGTNINEWLISEGLSIRKTY